MAASDRDRFSAKREMVLRLLQQLNIVSGSSACVTLSRVGRNALAPSLLKRDGLGDAHELGRKGEAAASSEAQAVANGAIVGGPAASRKPKQRGLQHLFAQAWAFHTAMESGEHRSHEALETSVAMGGNRVTGLVTPLQLSLEILVQADVPADELPPGVTEKVVRRLARPRTQAVQVREGVEGTASDRGSP